MKKFVSSEDLQVTTEWQCPYVKCGHYNTEHGVEPDWLEEVICKKCKRKLKVKSPY